MQTVSAPSATPLTHQVGAEIRGVDIASGVDESQMTFVRDTLHQHAVVLMRGQRITPQQQVDFSKRFGPPLRVSLFTEHKPPGVDELTVVSNVVRDGRPIGVMDAGALWHTDGAYLAKPDLYTVLYALEVPQRGGKPLGDTAFRNTQAAYEALSPETKERIEGLRAVQSLRHHIELRRQRNFREPPVTGKVSDVAPDVDHPIARAHPITGKKCLFVTEGHTKSVVGLPPAESEELLAELFAHLARPEFMYRHQWAVGDLLVWDNCSTQHLAITDYGDVPRLLYRAGIAGPVPV
jgi:taurine dioxygenase